MHKQCNYYALQTCTNKKWKKIFKSKDILNIKEYRMVQVKPSNTVTSNYQVLCTLCALFLQNSIVHMTNASIL